MFALDYSDGLTDLRLAAAAVTAFIIELCLFSVALRRITAIVAVGLFGLGTAAVAVISISWLDEPLTALKAIALLALIAGAGLLNTEGTKPHQEPQEDRSAGREAGASGCQMTCRSAVNLAGASACEKHPAPSSILRASGDQMDVEA